MTSRRLRAIHLAIALAVFVVEVLIATTFAHVTFVRASLGDYLVVVLLYHLVKAVTLARPRRLAVGVFLFACVVEGVQCCHPVDRLGLRPGSPLAIVMGNSFSWADILMYFLGCLTAWQLDARLLSRTAA
jgi:hypothetical protein